MPKAPVLTLDVGQQERHEVDVYYTSRRRGVEIYLDGDKGGDGAAARHDQSHRALRGARRPIRAAYRADRAPGRPAGQVPGVRRRVAFLFGVAGFALYCAFELMTPEIAQLRARRTATKRAPAPVVTR